MRPHHAQRLRTHAPWEEHALSKHAVELHRRTGGYFKALAYAISTAAVIAIRTGSENITMKEIDAATAQLNS